MNPVNNLSSNVQPLTPNQQEVFNYLSSKVDEVVRQVFSIIQNAHMNRAAFLTTHIKPAEKEISELDEKTLALLNRFADCAEKKLDEVDLLEENPDQKLSSLFSLLNQDEHKNKLSAINQKLLAFRQKVQEHMNKGNSEVPSEMVNEFFAAKAESSKWTNLTPETLHLHINTRRVLVQGVALPIIREMMIRDPAMIEGLFPADIRKM